MPRAPVPEPLDPYGLLGASVTHLDGRVELALFGELDLASADALVECMDRLARAHRHDIHLDMRHLTFLGSTGIGALVSGHRGLASDGRRLVLHNVTGAPRRSLELTRMLDQLIVE